MDPDTTKQIVEAIKDANNSDPATFGTILAATVATIVGSLAWIMRNTFGVAIPKMHEEHRADRRADQQAFLGELERQRVNCRDEHVRNQQVWERFLDVLNQKMDETDGKGR